MDVPVGTGGNTAGIIGRVRNVIVVGEPTVQARVCRKDRGVQEETKRCGEYSKKG
jgi:hypothetical protein